MRILLVEDDKGIAQFIRKGLLENSFSVDVASNGEEGLNSALRMRYDVVVLDILFPKIDGPEVLKRIRSSKPQKNLRLVDRSVRFHPAKMEEVF